MATIDWGYPNDKAISAMNAYGMGDDFLKKPDGTVQAAYDSWMAFYNKHQNSRTGVNYERWKDEVRAEHPEWIEARDWYDKNILDTDGWKNLVKTYKDNITDPSNVKPAAFTDQSDWIDDKISTGSGFEPPAINPTFKGDTASTSGVAVNTAALKWFAEDVLGRITGAGNILLTTADKLSAIDPRPGAFARAEVLRQAIVGATAHDGGVKGDMKDMLVNMNTALLAVQTALLKMAAEYENLEELNALTTDKLSEIMGDSFNGLENLKTYGQKVVKTDGN
ncbi:hypothetical protein AB0893_19430 [Micromonospora aurantiaca]|uniref:hypothetical protein n=1 Tax=Micromonospora aurantiaca (nom. illeg.) TaxID=47850 RepID=UPI0034522A76